MILVDVNNCTKLEKRQQQQKSCHKPLLKEHF